MVKLSCELDLMWKHSRKGFKGIFIACHSWVLLPKRLNTFSNTNLTVSVHYGTISNIQQLETRWICGQNGACLFCLTIKVVDTITTWLHLENTALHKGGWSQRAILYPFLWDLLNRQIHQDRKHIGFSEGLRGENEKPQLKRHRVSFWGDENVLELDSGEGCTTVCMY